MNEWKLSEAFWDQMKELLGEEEFKAYLKSFDQEGWQGLRVNTLKVTPEEFIGIAKIPLEPVAFIPEGFYYAKGERPARDPYYHAGLFYLQEPSAMTPASFLPVLPGDKVLDLCAAPGGKSTALGVKLKGRGILVSNDLSNSRAKALLKNLELWGIPNICVTSEAPERLLEAWGSWFQKILVDAPCSGEGMFRKSKDMIKSYEERGPEYYAGLQRGIMDQAIRLLCPDGCLIYSTCTFSRRENEEVVEYVLKSYEDMELLKLAPFDGAVNGVGLDGCLRLFPHRIKGEGHFIALLHKRRDPSVPVPEPISTRTVATGTKFPPELMEFLSHIRREFDPSRLLIRASHAYYLPEGFLPPEGLRYLRTGLYLGELKKNRFEPAQALAMALKKEEFDQSLSLEKSDVRVIRYLKGETVELTKDEGEMRGWCLVCVDGFPLGFAKGGGRILKNKYYPGWRWQ